MVNITHDLKIWPQFYEAILNGSKNFEVRNNDRGFQKGDHVQLMEFNNKSQTYTDRAPLKFTIGYVLPIDSERVVFSLLPYGTYLSF